MPLQEDLDFLAHYGVRGMQWGKRKKYEASDREPAGAEKPSVDKPKTDVLDRIIKEPKQKLSSDAQRQVAETQKKHNAKFEASEATDTKGWRPTKKQVAIAAVGAVAAAAIIYKLKTGKDLDAPGFSLDEYTKASRSLEAPPWMAQYAGKKMSPQEYKGLLDMRKGEVWAGSYVTTDSFAQKAFSLPAGHEFYRLSNRAETSFNPATYALHSKEDLSRYISTFEGVSTGKRQLISFKSTGEVKVPDMLTRLEATRKVLLSSGESDVTPERVIKKYTSLAGGSWDTNDGKKFMNVLKRQGYHAIIDDMDAGIYGESPLVLLDPGRFTKKKAAPITSAVAEHYQSMLTEIPNRR